MIIIQENCKVTITIFISLNKFKDGGAAILNINNKNHQTLIVGKDNLKPLFINTLRLLDRI